MPLEKEPEKINRLNLITYLLLEHLDHNSLLAKF